MKRRLNRKEWAKVIRRHGGSVPRIADELCVTREWVRKKVREVSYIRRGFDEERKSLVDRAAEVLALALSERQTGTVAKTTPGGAVVEQERLVPTQRAMQASQFILRNFADAGAKGGADEGRTTPTRDEMARRFGAEGLPLPLKHGGEEED